MKSSIASALLALLFAWLVWVIARALWRWVTGLRKSPGAPHRGDSIDDVASDIANASKVAGSLAGVLALIAAPTGLMAFAVSLGLVPVPLPFRLAAFLAAVAGACAVLAAVARMYAAASKRRASRVRLSSAANRGQ